MDVVRKNEFILNLVMLANKLQSLGNAFFKNYGLTSAQYNVLVLLRANPQGLTQVEISKNLVVSRANITSLLDKLESEGLAVRMRSEDRRSYKVVLTQKGKDLIQRIEGEYYRRVDEIFPDRLARGMSDCRKRISEWLAFLNQGGRL